MTLLVLNDETSKTTIGDLLASATGPIVDIKDESGQLLAKLVINVASQVEDYLSQVPDQAAEIEELRRRRHADRSRDVTTAQLIAKLEHLGQD
jgi:hypothetical protein